MTLMDGSPQDVVTNKPVMDVRDLRVWYGTTRGAIRAVDGVTFDLEKGETLGLVGESGCGKSTLGRGLMGLLPEGAKRDGEVLFKGDDILRMSEKEARSLRGAQLGMIFQEPLTRLNPLMRVSEHFEETINPVLRRRRLLPVVMPPREPKPETPQPVPAGRETRRSEETEARGAPPSPGQGSGSKEPTP